MNTSTCKLFISDTFEDFMVPVEELAAYQANPDVWLAKAHGVDLDRYRFWRDHIESGSRCVCRTKRAARCTATSLAGKRPQVGKLRYNQDEYCRLHVKYAGVF